MKYVTVPSDRAWDSEAYVATIDATGEVYDPATEFPAQTGMVIALQSVGTLYIGINLSALVALTSTFQTHVLTASQPRLEISCRAGDTIWLKAASGTVDISIQRYSDQGVV